MSQVAIIAVESAIPQLTDKFTYRSILDVTAEVNYRSIQVSTPCRNPDHSRYLG